MQPDCGWIAKRSPAAQGMHAHQTSDGLLPCMDMVLHHLQGGSSLSGKALFSTWACHGNRCINKLTHFLQASMLGPQCVQSELLAEQ